MKMLFCVSLYTPHVSGLTIHVQRIAEALGRKKVHAVSILTTQHDKQLAPYKIINNVTVKRVPYLFRVSKGFFMSQYFSHAWDLIQKNDVVIINTPQPESILIAIISKILKKKLFCIYHCEIHLPKSVLNIFIEIVLHGIHFITLAFSDKIITYTKDFADHSVLLPLFKEKVIYNFPPIPKPPINQKQVESLRKKFHLDSRYVIGVSARISAEKGIEYLLDAIPFMEKKLKKPIIILFAGPENAMGEEQYVRKIKPRLLKYQSNLAFLGTLSFEKIGAFYKVLDVLVLPSINSTEAFGMVQVEAMLCGTPVVATNLPGVRVPIQKTGMGEIAKIKDVDNLSEKIILVLQNKKRYTNKKRDIEKIFSIRNSIEKYQELFSNRLF